MPLFKTSSDMVIPNPGTISLPFGTLRRLTPFLPRPSLLRFALILAAIASLLSCSYLLLFLSSCFGWVSVDSSFDGTKSGITVVVKVWAFSGAVTLSIAGGCTLVETGFAGSVEEPSEVAWGIVVDNGDVGSRYA